jgi:hypothetical protein
MEGISPDIRAGVMAPYKETELQLQETLGAGGGLGSARGGFSGQGANALGKYWADVGTDYGQQLWNMVKDPLAMGWQAEQTGKMAQWGEQLQKEKYPYSLAPALMSSSLETPYAIGLQEGGKKSGGLGKYGPFKSGARGAEIFRDISFPGL